jgi:cytosine/adenosine deaminase-related metal-dependent hydrolase
LGLRGAQPAEALAKPHANVLQIGLPDQLRECFSMLTERSARLLNLKDYELAVGNPTDLVIIDAEITRAGGRRDPPTADSLQAWTS